MKKKVYQAPLAKGYQVVLEGVIAGSKGDQTTNPNAAEEASSTMKSESWAGEIWADEEE